MTISAAAADTIPAPHGHPQSAQNSWCFTRISSIVANPHSFPLSPVAIVSIPLSFAWSMNWFHRVTFSLGSPLFRGPPRAPCRMPFLLQAVASTVIMALGLYSSRNSRVFSSASSSDSWGQL